ncbi:unnamed protein product [Lasius platythorax]|uniref:Uncharacterized protein n=1 Tax=Lasius platythorax TaxID=488582 RepID=A0AAV2P1E0_9HYME
MKNRSKAKSTMCQRECSWWNNDPEANYSDNFENRFKTAAHHAQMLPVAQFVVTRWCRAKRQQYDDTESVCLQPRST